MRSPYGASLRHSPNDNLDNRPTVKDVPFVDQQLGLHVGENTNTIASVKRGR